MSTGAHTPGPWLRLNGEGIYTQTHDRIVHVAYVDNCFVQCNDDATASAAMREANAKLISAAPDMLEALRAAEIVLSQDAAREGSLILLGVRAAITKAGA